MTLGALLVRILWVGTTNHFLYTTPIVSLMRNPYPCRGLDYLLRDMYDLREPAGELAVMLNTITKSDTSTWYQHLPLLEEFYAPAC